MRSTPHPDRRPSRRLVTALLVAGHLLVLVAVVVVAVALVRGGVAAVVAATHAAHTTGARLNVLDPVRWPLLSLFEVGVGALAVAQIVAVRVLVLGWPRYTLLGRYALRPVGLVLGALASALPLALLAALPPAMVGPPGPARLAVLAVLAGVTLLLCGAQDGVQPHWWRGALSRLPHAGR